MGATGIAYKAAGTGSLSLGVSGLHDTVAGQMQVGRVYGLDTDVPSIRFPLIASCLASAMGEGVPCTLIVRSKPEHYLESLNTPPKFDMGEVLSRRQLNVFSMQDDFQKKLFQVGPNRMLGELTRYGVESGSLVVFEHASELLNMFDLQYASAQLDAISDWCANQGITALLVFSGTQVRNALPPKALLDGMAGMARMEQGLDGLLISFPYWRSNGQLVSGLLTRLQMSAQGEYIASPLMLASPDWVRPVQTEEWPGSGETEVLVPAGPKIAFSGGDTADHKLIWAKLDQVHAKHSDMVLMHGGSPKGAEKIAAKWAETRKVPQVAFKPDWTKHAKAAPFKRNDAMLAVMPIGVLIFPGTGIQDNLADKARKLGIPVWKFGGG